MNMKNKYAWSREGKSHSNRYLSQSQHFQSTPSLNKGWQKKQIDKENNLNVNNFQAPINHSQKIVYFDPVKSMEVPKRLRISGNQQDFGQFKKNKALNQQQNLKSSQDFFKFRQKMTTQPCEDTFFKGQNLTFGDVVRSGIVTSRQFLQEKRVKNEVIDEIMANAKRGLCKSFNQFTIGSMNCVNHPQKKAKYRLLSELSEGEEEMFYCSKCAINLLQQNFKIEQIRPEQTFGQKNSQRLQQITKLQLRLKSLQERAKVEAEKSYVKEDIDLIDEEIMMTSNRFDDIMEILQKMKKQWLSKLNSLKLKKQNEDKNRKDEIYEMLGNMRDIQQQIKEYKNMKKFVMMKENEFTFISSSLNNKISKFEDDINKTKLPSPYPKSSYQIINEVQIVDKLKERMLELRQKVKQRRQRQITFSRRSQPKQKISEDDFICDQLKRPFRVLFPTEEAQNFQNFEQSRMLNSLRERSTYDILQ